MFKSHIIQNILFYLWSTVQISDTFIHSKYLNRVASTCGIQSKGLQESPFQRKKRQKNVSAHRKMTRAQILLKFSPGSSAQMLFLLWPWRKLQTKDFPLMPRTILSICTDPCSRWSLSIMKHKN